MKLKKIFFVFKLNNALRSNDEKWVAWEKANQANLRELDVELSQNGVILPFLKRAVTTGFSAHYDTNLILTRLLKASCKSPVECFEFLREKQNTSSVAKTLLLTLKNRRHEPKNPALVRSTMDKAKLSGFKAPGSRH